MVINILYSFYFYRTPKISLRKKSSTDPLVTPPVRRTRQSTNLESFKAYRSSEFFLIF